MKIIRCVLKKSLISMKKRYIYIYIIPIIYDPTLSSITDKKSSESNSNITSHLLSVVRQTAAHGHLRPKFRYDLDLNLDTTWPLKSHSWLCPKIWYRQILWFPIHFFFWDPSSNTSTPKSMAFLVIYSNSIPSDPHCIPLNHHLLFKALTRLPGLQDGGYCGYRC